MDNVGIPIDEIESVQIFTMPVFGTDDSPDVWINAEMPEIGDPIEHWYLDFFPAEDSPYEDVPRLDLDADALANGTLPDQVICDISIPKELLLERYAELLHEIMTVEDREDSDE